MVDEVCYSSRIHRIFHKQEKISSS
jgi:hypothetical protein